MKLAERTADRAGVLSLLSPSHAHTHTHLSLTRANTHLFQPVAGTSRFSTFIDATRYGVHILNDVGDLGTTVTMNATLTSLVISCQFYALFLQVTIKCLMYHSRQWSKLFVLSVLPFLLLCYGVSDVRCSTVQENNQDLRSLLEFRQGISDPTGTLRNWNTSTHFCRWHGVTCTLTRPWHVRELNLAGQNLAGQISPSLGNLTFLNKLDLFHNNFHGPIPPLNELQHLHNLSLGNNLLQGVIPVGLMNCSNLRILSLTTNNLTGTIPPSIGFLSKLELIYFYQNGLTGVIPPALGNITTLEIVDLDSNQLSGRIPYELWQTSSIERLDLGDNNYLSGGIPNPLPNISSLTQLSLASNMLSGELPPNIGDALPNIQDLFLANNNFKGRIPASLGKPLGLKDIDLSHNLFTGQIPSSFGKLRQLEYLSLGDNSLEARDSEGWEFFGALSNCSHLNVLALNSNYLQGAIPNSIANLTTNLTYLVMGGNQLSGIVPPSIGKLGGLTNLGLDYNNLTGTIIEWIGKLRKLEQLYLDSNNFTGTIPPSISNLTQLESLFLEDNNFMGLIPSSMGSLQKLLRLNLSYNNFQGNIPVEFGNFAQIIELDISFNKFDGEIPQTLGQLEYIQTIQMDHNILTGNIPITFTKLLTLMVLNISYNNLSGSVPAYLNDMKSLDRLDISYNNFQGEIPTNGVLDNATIVSLEGNPGLCGGAVGLHLPSCHVKSRKVDRAKYLVKILIPIFGFMLLVLLVYFLLPGKKTSRRREHVSENSFGEHFEKVTYNDLAQETQGFSESNMIGRGRYGTVYRARLKESRMEVAVKIFNLEMRGAERSFLSECEALIRIQHRNLLPIVTACSSIDNAGNDFKALAYELMPNGDLDSWLHHNGDEESSSRRRLGLTQRINIAVNVADALNYLHHDCGRPTVHCDVKPSNILLDGDMNARLGDFGIARFYTDIQSTWAGSTSSVGVKGTIGYIPPEYGGGGHVSTSGDVYSFGIVLLQMLTGKRPTDSMFMDGLDIVSFVENNLPDRIFHVVDAHLEEECMYLTQGRKVPGKDIYQCLEALLQVALSCTRSLPSERLNMKQVAIKLHAIKASHLGWNL